MVKITILFGHPVDPEAFEHHYAESHLPLVPRLPWLQRVELGRMVRTLGTPDGSRPPYYRAVDLYFDGLDRLAAALGSREGRAVIADLATFATGGVTILVCQLDE